jgi:hypothetical protein
MEINLIIIEEYKLNLKIKWFKKFKIIIKRRRIEIKIISQLVLINLFKIRRLDSLNDFEIKEN